MNKITKLELAMTLMAIISFGTIYGIWRYTSKDNLASSTPVLKVEKKLRPEKLVEKPAEKEEGFVGTGSPGITFNP